MSFSADLPSQPGRVAGLAYETFLESVRGNAHNRISCWPSSMNERSEIGTKAGDLSVNTFLWLLSGVVSAIISIALIYLVVVRHHRRSGDEVDSIYPLYRDRLEISRDTVGGTLDERLARTMRTGMESRILAPSPGTRFSILRVGWPVTTAAITIILSFAAIAILLLVGYQNLH
jgi:hypothetical protein